MSPSCNDPTSKVLPAPTAMPSGWKSFGRGIERGAGDAAAIVSTRAGTASSPVRSRSLAMAHSSRPVSPFDSAPWARRCRWRLRASREWAARRPARASRGCGRYGEELHAMTRYVIGPDVALRLARDRAVVREEHELLAPTLIRSQLLSLLHQAVGRGEMTKREAEQRLTYVRELRL